MKVTLLNDSFPPVIDGVANVVMNYAKIMHEENLCDVMVGTPEYPGAEYHTYPYMVVPYHSFDTTKIVKGYRAGNPLDVVEMKTMVDYKPDLIHTHCPVSSTYLARMLRFYTEAPVVFTYHTKFDVDIAKAVKAKVVQKEVINTLVHNIESCDEVWVVSKGAGENLKSLGYQGEYRVVNNGVDFDRGYVSDQDVAKVTKGYDLPADVPVFLFVGRIVKYKGLPLIIDALSKLSDAGIPYRMVFVGSGPDEKEIKEQAERKLPAGSYFFTGPIYNRDELRAWNTRADLFLFPSTYDTNGIVVREAAACGLASVLIKGSCAAEGITDGRNGFLIEETAESMYELLKKIGTDIPHLNEVGEHAMNEIYISWQDSVHAAYDRYAQILDDKKSGKLELKHHLFAKSLLQIKDGYETVAKEFSEEYDKVQQFFKEKLDDLI